MQKLPTVLFGAGLVTLILSVTFGWVLVPMVIEDQVKDQTRFYNGSYSWMKWTVPNNEIFMNIRIFNVTNAEEVSEGAIPIFVELGPYVYEEKRPKTILSVDEENDTITFKEPKFYYFREDLSNGSEDDLVTTINIPLVAVSQRLADYPRMIRYLVGIYIMKFKEGLFIKRTVGELLFRGYYSKMVEELQAITGENLAPGNRIGIYYGRNGTDDGILEIKAGNKDSSTFNQIMSWNGKPKLDFWQGEKCNRIKGSDAASFPPFSTKKTIIPIYHADSCRSVELNYAKNIQYKGVHGYRYELASDTFASGTDKPENECFCLKPGKNGEGCPKSGVMSMASCQRGAPATISFPHFLHAPYYLNKTIGLHPDPTKHTTYAEIEPLVGALLRGSKMGQVNIDLKRVAGVDGFKSVPEMMFPVLWQEEVGLIDDETYGRIISELQLPLKIVDATKWLALCLSSIIIITSVSIFAMRAKKKYYYV